MLKPFRQNKQQRSKKKEQRFHQSKIERQFLEPLQAKLSIDFFASRNKEKLCFEWKKTQTDE